MKSDIIRIQDASKNNLKHISLNIPKYRITVFTGVSGSGKSSLVMDTVAAQSRRELNDTFPGFVQNYLPKYGRPHVGKIENLPVAIVIDQKKPAPNLRSTLGTYTDIYTLLRLLFSRVGKPFVGYSDAFSFNHPQGKCPRCDGLGEITELDVHKLVDFDKCLNDPGVIHYAAFEPGQWRWIRYANSGLFDLSKKIRDYSQEELELFLNSPQIRLKNPPAGWPKTAKYEGLVHRMYRSVLNSEEGKLHQELLASMTRRGICPECGGARLKRRVLECRIGGKNIAEAAAMPMKKLKQWLEEIQDSLAEDLKRTIGSRIGAMIEIGLGYLTLDRGMGTLSGGEAQRCKIAKYLNSSLSDMLYILDEPSVGLHSHDIDRLVRAIRRLRDAGNTVLVVEHHREMIREADYVIDMGPGAGKDGGEILFSGTVNELLGADTDTARLLCQHAKTTGKHRIPDRWYEMKELSYHNLKQISVKLPLGVMTVVAGVAGSGKSSLMECFCRECKEETVYISQKNIGISLRSTPATYTGAADEIRKLFARKCGTRAGMFSFNGEGKCPVCQGRGVIVSDMAFMDSIETVCEACGGLRYSDEALQYCVNGYNIAQVMDLTVGEAAAWLEGTNAAELLQPLILVGLSYLHLNQAMSTLSGGELQRMKLAVCLNSSGKIFVLDEPSDGLHMKDIDRMLQLFQKLVDDGNTLFLIEHNLDLIRAADYVIELGPEGGEVGGRLLFAGTPEEMMGCGQSVTAPYLREECKKQT